MGTLLNYIRREPALVAGFVQAALALAVVFGLPITQAEQGAVLAFSAAALALIVRHQVSPVSDEIPADYTGD